MNEQLKDHRDRILDRDDVEGIHLWRGLCAGERCYQFTVVMIDGDEFNGQPNNNEDLALRDALEEADEKIAERDESRAACMEDT